MQLQATESYKLRLWPLAAGLVVLLMLWLGPLPAMSRTAFSAHMMLHLGIVSVASPMVALGLVHSGAGNRFFDASFISPGLAIALDLVVVWGWHSPPLHEAAARTPLLFVLQQASFLVAGVTVWSVSFRAGGARAGVGILVMFVTFMHMAMLGILLTLAPELLYAPDLCIGAFGFRGLEDQRLGGLLMASLGGLPYLLGGMVLTYRMLR